jgi:GntR family transcriptional regulator/MocR family aminotransferase
LPLIELKPRARLPLHEQLYLALRQQILDGRLRGGVRLASTRALAVHLDVSRFTVVTAMERLVAEGYLTTRVGAGTFVTATSPERLMRPTPHRTARRRRDTGTPAGLSRRGREQAGLRITGPRPGEPRAFHPRRAPLDVFPRREWSAIVRRLWKKGGSAQLDYGDPAGWWPLREAIAAHVSETRAVRCVPNQVIVTAGSQQAFDVLCRVLLDPGDRAWIEEPGYLDVRAALIAAGAELVPVPVDASGIDVAQGIKRGVDARLAIVSPAHQYPSGVTLSAARGIRLLDWARSSGAWIVEDDYDSYFRYAGRPMSALQGIDRATSNRPHVIYVGTFSKTVYPSLRLGFCVVPDSLIDAVTNARAIADRNSSILDQAALAEFITSGRYDRHLRRLRVVCEERYDATRSHFERVFGPSLTLSRVLAGTHVIADLGNDRDHDRHGALASRISLMAADQGLVVFPLSRYCVTPSRRNALVLGFGGVTPRQIGAGAEQLASIIRAARTHSCRSATTGSTRIARRAGR